MHKFSSQLQYPSSHYIKSTFVKKKKIYGKDFYDGATK